MSEFNQIFKIRKKFVEWVKPVFVFLKVKINLTCCSDLL